MAKKKSKSEPRAFVPIRKGKRVSRSKAGGRDYKDKEYTAWRAAVRKRDHNKCRWPGCPSRGRIYCHHIMMWAYYPSLRFVVSNGICLCYKHHKQVTGNESTYAGFLYGLINKDV